MVIGESILDNEVASEDAISSVALNIKLFLFQAVSEPCEKTFRVINVCYLQLNLQIDILGNIIDIMGQKYCYLLGAKVFLADETLLIVARQVLIKIVILRIFDVE